jgi:hypothetical protein
VVMRAHAEPHSSKPVAHRPRTMDSAPPNDGCATMDAVAGRGPACGHERRVRARSGFQVQESRSGRGCPRARSVARHGCATIAGRARAVHTQAAVVRRHCRARDRDSTVPSAEWRSCPDRKMYEPTCPSTRATALPKRPRTECHSHAPWFRELGWQSECAPWMTAGGLAARRVEGCPRTLGMRERSRAGYQGLPPDIDGASRRA